ncbi:hypothetical protein J6590_106612, partial [Homalodisca vitripennis]
ATYHLHRGNKRHRATPVLMNRAVLITSTTVPHVETRSRLSVRLAGIFGLIWKRSSSNPDQLSGYSLTAKHETTLDHKERRLKRFQRKTN